MGLLRSSVQHFANLVDIATRSLIAAAPHSHPKAGADKIELEALSGDTLMIQKDPPGVGL
ncbi:hypothetical protein [Citrobacter sp. wls619]|uniref:hypothetical protein n=1 Tax=Citrobacter sp. wls619 TaxID=2576432 RepID=UPI00148510DD|nr:hypothetical protein [Citrobacter sp. wls619]